MNNRTLQGSLTFLGFVISIMAVFYFAVEYLDDVSDWTRVAALVLLALMFAFAGVAIRGSLVGQPFFEGDRMAWLRPTYVLYLLAIITGIIAEGFFLGIDDVETPIKILVSLAIGLGLIFWVARVQMKEHKADKSEE